MAQYKVPQDVEADDKLIGPFSFRQFVYLMVAGGLGAAAVGLFQLFPALAIIPVPFVLFFLALALPLKKDQPMETYLAAIVSFYLKPHARVWMTGQKENPILITAPKKVDDFRTRDITGEEATHRLSFLADIVDTGGYAIKGAGANPMREDLMAEANATPDMFETYQSQVINRVIDQDKMSRHQSAVNEMREAIKRNDPNFVLEEPTNVKAEPVADTKPENSVAETAAKVERLVNGTEPSEKETMEASNVVVKPEMPKIGGLRDYAVLKPDVDVDSSEVLVRPEIMTRTEPKKVTVPGMDYSVERAAINEEMENADNEESEEAENPVEENTSKNPVNDSIIELANNPDFSVATIAKEANRINKKGKEENEIFVSLH